MDIEQAFINFLQKDLIFSVDGRNVKEGKLILFCKNDYYISFTLKTTSESKKKYEIPYPFSFKMGDGYIILSYEIDKMSDGQNELFYKLLSLNKKTNAKIYNNKMVIFDKNMSCHRSLHLVE
jgi:hypothetical protein